MNPNAKEFVFNPSAAAWQPGRAVPVVSNNPPQPPPVSPPPPTSTAQENIVDDKEDDVDENDPLWKVTLKICNGDRKQAMKMLEDPDSLMMHPEVVAVMDATTPADEDNWESQADELVAPMQEKANISEKETAESPNGKKEAEVEDSIVEPEEEIVVEDEDARQHMNLVFIGHVDAGKSTLSGSILYTMGKVDSRTIEKYEREAKERNRESWFLAFIMDTSEEERAKGKTVEVGRAHFETDVTRFTILDAPGHKNYVPNMISGAAQADVGVLVISARKGEFETGFEKGGQTREHALLARTIGVDHLVVVINKMDDPTVEWSQERYTECVTKLKPYLKQVGYVIKTDVKFIPISGLTGDNILKEVDSSRCPWWKELYSSGTHNTTTPTLLSTLDSLTIGNRNPNGPLRVPCLDRYFERGCVVLGKVESGTLRRGDEIAIMPTRKKVKVEDLCIDEKKVRTAKPGENVLVRLNVPVEDIQKGYVLCSPSALCPAVTEIKVVLALVEMLEHRPVFTSGYNAVMHCHTEEIEVECVKLIGVYEKGKLIPRQFARTGQQCEARLRMPIKTCVEPFERAPRLGRVTLRDEGRTIAIGKVLALYKPQG